jgi:tetratricopeptide (TPR) repeat protein
MANRLAALAVFASLWLVMPTTSQAQNSGLTPELLNKMVKLAAEQGSDKVIDAAFATPLGLTVNQAWPSRRLTTKDQHGDLHTLDLNRGTEKDIVIYSRPPGGIFKLFRARRDGTIVKAFYLVLDTKQFTARGIQEAQKDFEAEIAYWAASVERLASTQEWTWCEGQPGGANAISPELRIRGCTTLIQSSTQTPRNLALAYVNRGRAYNTKRDDEAASKDFDQAVKADPGFATAWAASCSFHMWTSHDSERAQKECSTAIKLDPKDSSGWTYRGDIYLNLRDYEQAIQDYNHAIELAPNWMWPWDNRGEAYLRMNNVDRAIQDFEQVIKLAPDYAMGYLDRGMAYIRKKQFDLALADFEKGLKVDSKSAQSLFGRGIVKRLKGDQAGGNSDIASARAMNSKVAELFEKNGIDVP